LGNDADTSSGTPQSLGSLIVGASTSAIDIASAGDGGDDSRTRTTGGSGGSEVDVTAGAVVDVEVPDVDGGADDDATVVDATVVDAVVAATAPISGSADSSSANSWTARTPAANRIDMVAATA
jgi:hypothetical protein